MQHEYAQIAKQLCRKLSYFTLTDDERFYHVLHFLQFFDVVTVFCRFYILSPVFFTHYA